MTAPSTNQRVIIFDTTLRDGEQSPGCSMNLEEKLRDRRRCSRRWASTSSRPASRSPRTAISRRCARSPSIVKVASVCGLARAGRKPTSTAAAKRCRPAPSAAHPYLHLDLAAAYEVQAADGARAGAGGGDRQRLPCARNFVDDVEWSAEDGSRTEHDFLCRTRRSGDQGRRRAPSISPTRSAMPCPRNIAALITMLIEPRAQYRPGHLLDPLPQRSGPGGRQFAGRRAARARARSNAPSTASASAPATPRWKRS